MEKEQLQHEQQKEVGKAGVLAIPEEVFYGNIFPHLEFNDLLRLRRVCQPIKEFTNGFLRNYFSSHEREINETDATIGDFLRLNIPTSAIYINNSGPNFFENPDMPKFLKRFSDQITHLRARHFSTCISDAELQFYSALSNLEHLELEFIDARKRCCLSDLETSESESEEEDDVKIEKPRREKAPFPQNFSSLKSLKLHEIRGSDIYDQGYAWDFMDFCLPKLEYLSHPLYKRMQNGVENHFNGPFGCFGETIFERKLEDESDSIEPRPKLKFFDLEHYIHKRRGYWSLWWYPNMVRSCFLNGVKLLNVPAGVYDIAWTAFSNAPQLHHMFTTPLASIKNVHGFLFLEEHPNLEKVVILSTAKSSFFEPWLEGRGEEPEWPNLNSVDININSVFLSGEPELPEKWNLPAREIFSQPTEKLLDFLFVGKERDELKELSIRYSEQPDTRGNLPIPRVQDITMSCRNLTKLTLTNWLGTNKAVSKFWEGLPLLEDVTMDKCKLLGDAAFVGKRREDPTFFKLKKLNSFTLNGLHQMPKLTDLIFHLVFRHLKIKQFHLQSDEPLKSITIAGTQSLLTGQFNTSVEKFSFDGWSLEGVSAEDFGQLKSQFRSSHML